MDLGVSNRCPGKFGLTCRSGTLPFKMRLELKQLKTEVVEVNLFFRSNNGHVRVYRRVGQGTK